MSNAMTKQPTKQNGDVATVAGSDDVARSWASAPVDVFEGPDEYLVLADVPGVKKDDINIQYADGELRLHAQRRFDEEHWPSELRRTFTVGREVDVEKISAELDQGVLTVHLPKLESAKPRQITIKVA